MARTHTTSCGSSWKKRCRTHHSVIQLANVLLPIMDGMKKIIYVDVDGCICTTSYDNKNFKDIESSYIHVEPHLDRIERINRLFEEGHHIVYWTARGCKSGIDMTNLTRDQLQQWGAKYSDLQVGTKPHFDMYICDKSWNSESFFHRQKLELP